MDLKKNIMINTTVLVSGGGVQVAVSIIHELMVFAKFNYIVILSNAVANQINKEEFPENFTFYQIDSPASLLNRRRILGQLNEIEKKHLPEIVFSVFGPSYWKPKGIHITGFALPWLVYLESPIFKTLNIKESIRQFLIRKYKWFYFKTTTDYIITETQDVKDRINEIYKFPLENVFVVGNTCNSIYDEYKSTRETDNSKFKLITISAHYPHKNLKIIKKIIPILKGKLKFEFRLTINQEEFEELFTEDEQIYVKNIGSISVKDCPIEYDKADAVFLPTLLECFSANYPEAMSMKKPILTSNYSFAKNVCQGAAEYFDPFDAEGIAEKILFIANNIERREELIRLGTERLTDFPSAKQRAEMYINIISNILDKDY